MIGSGVVGAPTELTDSRGELTDPRGELTDPRGELTDPRGEAVVLPDLEDEDFLSEGR